MEDRPHFIPPRKRQSGRKTTSGIISHGDHIMTVQGQNSADSSLYQEIDEEIKTTSNISTSRYKSIADRPKLELPNEIYTVDSTRQTNSLDLKNSIKYQSHDHKDINKTDISQSRQINSLENSIKNQSHKDISNKLSEMNKTDISHSRHIKNKENSLKNISQDSINISPVFENISEINQISNSENSLEMSSLKYKSANKKRVNIKTETETSLEQNSLSVINNSSNDKYLTMTGTIKNGRKNTKNINVQLNISREQLEILESDILAKNSCICNLKSGLHILIWSLICIPFVTLISSVYSFYLGTLTWYNVFTFISEEKSILVRLFVTPILVLLYPFTIVICTIGLGLYAGVRQVSIYGPRWFKEVSDIEKGFYGWLCAFIRLSECSPYEIVVLTDLRDDEKIQNLSVDEF